MTQSLSPTSRKRRTIACIILNWNGANDTLNCVNSLRRSNLPPQTELKLIVVDNASSDNSLSILQKIPGVTCVSNPQNLGYAGGNNSGLQAANLDRPDYYWIINPDVEVHPRCLYELVKFSSSHTRPHILSPKIYFYPGNEYHSNYGRSEKGKVIWYAGGELDRINILGKHRGVDEVDHGQFSQSTRIEFATGACLFLSSKALEILGGFDTQYFLYLEDLDLSTRASKASVDLYFVPSAIAWHKNSTSSSVGGDLHDYYISRNRLLYGLTHCNLRTRLALIRQSIRLLVSGRKWQKTGVIDFYLGKLGQGSYSPQRDII